MIAQMGLDIHRLTRNGDASTTAYNNCVGNSETRKPKGELPMNYFDLLFIVVTLGAGIGVGAGMAKGHGFLGFAGGLLLTIAASLIVLSLLHLGGYIWKKRLKR